MIEAVLWDFGGVLTSSPFEAFNRFEEEQGLPHNFIRSINSQNPNDNAWAQFERNEISPAEFDLAFAKEAGKAGHPIKGADIIALLAGDLRPNMVEALRLCSEHFKVACITNNVAAGQGPGMTTDAATTAAVQDVLALFHKVFESSKLGLRKPDPKIYMHACNELGVQPSQCIYLDDLGINLKPARALGMTTIKVTDPLMALEALSAATDLIFTP